jgi:hypothetical protein
MGTGGNVRYAADAGTAMFEPLQQKGSQAGLQQTSVNNIE